MFAIYFAIGNFLLYKVFLDILLKDEKLTKKINENCFNDFVVGCVFMLAIAIPVLWVFFIIPVANTDLFGPSTYDGDYGLWILG